MSEAAARKQRAEEIYEQWAAKPDLRLVGPGSEPDLAIAEPASAETAPESRTAARDDDAVAWMTPAAGRRTVRITGHPDPYVRGRRRRRRSSQVGARPDRVALWAVVLGMFLLGMAGITANADAAGAVPAPPAASE